MNFHREILNIDCQLVTEKICAFIRNQVETDKRRGLVVGLSGGVDSALCASLCVKAVGTENVVGLILPEKDSDPISREYAEIHASNLGIRIKVIDVTQSIASFGAYDQLTDALKSFFPDYSSKCKFKIALPGDLLNRDSFNFYTLVVDDGSGRLRSTQLIRRA